MNFRPQRPSVLPCVIRAALLSAALAAPLTAQSRELSWPVISVEARLDSAGRLQVVERQTTLFTGDWNGGERSFNVRRGQALELSRIARVDSATGAEVELRAGDLSDVDQFDWVNGNTLRWRSRLPSDPPFNGTAITYVLEYTWSNILVPMEDGRFLLDHDFAFTDRSGSIDRFTLELVLDRAWTPPGDFRGRLSDPNRGSFIGHDLAPGAGFVIHAPLTWRGAGRPAAVDYGASGTARLLLAGLLLAPLLPLGLRLAKRERALGRFAPLPAARTVDEAWLGANVLAFLPEVVGSAWDDSTGAAEVAATLARLVQEGKVTSSVRTGGRGLFARDVLHLRLVQPRSSFTGHERALIDGLFVSGEDTDTTKVRTHYKSKGFDPSALIRKPLAILVDATPGTGTTLPKPSRRVSLALLVVAVVSLVVGLLLRPQDTPRALTGMGIAIAVYLLSLLQAAFWRRRVARLGVHSLRFLLPLGAMVVAMTWLLLAPPSRAGAPVLAGLTLLCLAIVNSVLNQAMARQSIERIALRKSMAAARDHFRRELRRDKPALRDEWFPYLIAFGLGPHIDKWFRAFGAARTAAAHAPAMTSSSRSSAPAASSSWTGFGGGGGFSGGGTSASFASAFGAMGASVPKPSSGGSGGGGGGGGGSSGGGGGGGW